MFGCFPIKSQKMLQVCGGELRPGASPPVCQREEECQCVGHNEGEGIKEHKQDRNEDGGRQEGTEKTGKDMRLCGDGSSATAGEV